MIISASLQMMLNDMDKRGHFAMLLYKNNADRLFVLARMNEETKNEIYYKIPQTQLIDDMAKLFRISQPEARILADKAYCEYEQEKKSNKITGLTTDTVQLVGSGGIKAGEVQMISAGTKICDYDHNEYVIGGKAGYIQEHIACDSQISDLENKISILEKLNENYRQSILARDKYIAEIKNSAVDIKEEEPRNALFDALQATDDTVTNGFARRAKDHH